MHLERYSNNSQRSQLKKKTTTKSDIFSKFIQIALCQWLCSGPTRIAWLKNYVKYGGKTCKKQISLLP